MGINAQSIIYPYSKMYNTSSPKHFILMTWTLQMQNTDDLGMNF